MGPLLRSYAIGSLVGGSAAALEWLLLRPLTLPALAFYSLVAGLAAAVTRAALAPFVPGRAARMGSLVVVSGFGSVYVLYAVNVGLLPGEPYWTAKSLVADVAVTLLIGLAIVRVVRPVHLGEVSSSSLTGLAGVGASLLAGATALVAVGWPADARPETRMTQGPNLLLLVLDSVRRDRLGFHGHRAATSERLDALAPAGRVYDQALAASSWTVPAVHRMLRAPGRADRTLAGELAARGYRTAIFTDNPHLVRGTTVLDGFAHVECSVGPWRVLLQRTIAGEVVDRLFPRSDERLVTRALEWAGRGSGPFLLYVHLMDSHTPYRHARLDGVQGRGRHIEFPVSGMAMTEAEAEDVVARYEGGIRSAADQAARLLTGVRALGRPFVAVLTADHGESLGESGRWFHGKTLAPELLAVPLVVLGEGVVPGRVARPVGHAATAPTLLAAAGVPGFATGATDLRTSSGADAVEGGLAPDLSYRVAGRWKVVLDHRHGRRSLFDITRDPKEEHDLAAVQPEIAATLGEALRRPDRQVYVPSPELAERLRAVGYLQ
jgi:sulfatase-like protein